MLQLDLVHHAFPSSSFLKLEASVSLHIFAIDRVGQVIQILLFVMHFARSLSLCLFQNPAT